MAEQVLLDWPQCCVNQMMQQGDTVDFRVESEVEAANCPDCQFPSRRVHSYYLRTLRDLPIGEYCVVVHIKVRRFRCVNAACPRKTFVEPLTHLTRRYARRTERLTQKLWHVVQVAGAQAGSRLADHLHMPAARDTLLRLLRRKAVRSKTNIRCIGVDDWAKRRGRDYGSIIVDLEAHQVIDLLPDRQAQTLAQWLAEHPEIQYITRDRSKEYAQGIQQGAPQAIQIADRWHLLKNATEMAERALLELLPRLQQTPAQSTPLREVFPRSKPEMERQRIARERRLQDYTRVQYLKARGHSQRQIADLLSLHRTTVSRYYTTTYFPERQVVYRPSRLDPFLPYLQKRWSEGCHQARILWQEIQAQGYEGRSKQVAKWTQNQRQTPALSSPDNAVSPPTPIALPALRNCLIVLIRLPDQLSDPDRALLHFIRQFQPVEEVYQLVQRFMQLVRHQQVDDLDTWLSDCSASTLLACQHFAEGLRQDYSAVRAALRLPWSNGQVEGQVNRLKTLKRQMYGRAKLDLLKLRLLYSPT